MVAEFFRDGGAPMILTAISGLLLIASSVGFLLRSSRRFAALSAALGALTLGSGALGTSIGLVLTFRYLPRVAGSERSAIAALGCAESLNNAIFALAIFTVAAAVIAVGAFRANRLRLVR